jgi:5-methylthioribose kinase
LYRYNLADVLKDSLGFAGVKMSRRIVVGLLYKLNPVDPWLESTLFQPLSL